MGVLNKLFGRFLLKSDPSATTQTTAVIQATDTDSGIAIVPNGTGAITNVVPDGSNLRGDARGDYAVDLSYRINQGGGNTRIAAGQYSVMFGYNNRVANDYSIIAGGQGNTLSSGGNSNTISGGQNNLMNLFGGFSVIAGGSGNTISQVSGVISGGQGNTVSSARSVISGGESNTASTNTHATVIGGYQNSSTGQYSVSGGYSNVASGFGSVALGYDNTASGVNSVALGKLNTSSGNSSFSVNESNTASGSLSSAFGWFTISSNQASISMGVRSRSYLSSQFAQSNNRFSNNGDQQSSFLTRGKQDTLTTGATTTVASDLIPNDGSSNNRVWNVTIKYTAVVRSITGTATGVSVGDCKNEVLTIGFKNIGGTSSVVGSLNTLSTNEDSSMSTASLSVTAGSSQEMKLDFTAPTFTGGGSVTTRVVAKVELTEVAY